MKKKIIINLIKNLFNSNGNNIIFYNFQNKFKKNTFLIFQGKKKIKKVFFIFFLLLFRNIKFSKNFFLLFQFKKNICGHNLIPDWPGHYKNHNFVNNLFSWLKLLMYFVIFRKNLFLIIIKLN